MATEASSLEPRLLCITGTVVAGTAVTAAAMPPLLVCAYGEHIAFYVLLHLLLLSGVALVYIGIWVSPGRPAIAKAALRASAFPLALAVGLAGLAAVQARNDVTGLVVMATALPQRAGQASGEHVLLASSYILSLVLLLLGVALVYIGIRAASGRPAIAKAAMRASIVPLALSIGLAGLAVVGK